MENLSVALLVYGVIATCLYVGYNRPYDPKEDSVLPSSIGPIPDDIPELKNLFSMQYEQVNEAVRSRENVTVVVGSLFVTASVLLMSSAADPLQTGSVRQMLVLASLALYSIWLLAFSLPANMLSSMELFQLRQMEKKTQNKINMHTYLWEKVKNAGWYKVLRRQIWIAPFWVLVIACIYLLEIL